MFQKWITLILGSLLTIGVLVGCNTASAVSNDNTSTSTAAATTLLESTSTTAASTSTATLPATATAVLAENSTPTTVPTLAAASDDGTITITLNGSTIEVEGSGVTVEGSTATITAAGSYRVTGTLDNGQVVVDSEEEAPVYLTLDNATISNSSSAPLYIKQAEAIEIILADGSNNTLTDGSTYTYASADEDEPNAALFSDDELLISGSGTLTVQGNYNDGIASKDGLTITGGTIIVTAVDDGIRGKDYLIVEGGNFSVTAGGDGFKSDNADDTTLGYIAVSGGTLNVTAGGDGITAETDLVVTAGDITVTSGGGSEVALAADLSAKGLKAGVNLVLEGGTFAINSSDDALHSDNGLTINNGRYTLASGDDGIHGEVTLTINGGEITITDSYEGIEGAAITLNAGSVAIVSSDDAVNAAGGTSAGTTQGGPRGGGGGAPMGGGGNYTLTINGGTLVMDAGGDGLDANGTITMTDGLVIVNGPTERMNGALDYDGGFAISGGTLVAVGSAGMATAPGQNSSQNSLLLFFNQVQAAGTVVHIEDSAGNTVLTFTPTKSFQALTFSTATLQSGETYQVYLGGSSTTTDANGYTVDGDYTGGTVYTSFTVSSTVTQVGSGGGGFR